MHRPVAACNKNHGYQCDPVELIDCQLALRSVKLLHACLGGLALRKGQGQSEQSNMCRFQPLTLVPSPLPRGEARPLDFFDLVELSFWSFSAKLGINKY
jgi:hypothetical protein